MKRGAGKAKGSAFERDICKQLSIWATKGKRDDVFWRSAMSGGRATVSAKKGDLKPHVSGDICAVHPDGYPLIETYYIECKFYRDLTFTALICSNSGLVARFWETASNQAEVHGKLPMLILKQNQHPALVGLCHEGASKVPLQSRADLQSMDLYLYSLEEFLFYAKPPTGKQHSSVRSASHLKRKG